MRVPPVKLVGWWFIWKQGRLCVFVAVTTTSLLSSLPPHFSYLSFFSAFVFLPLVFHVFLFFSSSDVCDSWRKGLPNFSGTDKTFTATWVTDVKYQFFTSQNKCQGFCKIVVGRFVLKQNIFSMHIKDLAEVQITMGIMKNKIAS